MKLIIGNKNYSSWSLRAWLAVKACGHEFEEIHIRLRQPDTKTQILRWSPSGKVPCLVDNDLAIWDSLAICEYLAEESPHLWPLDGAARAIARSISAEMHSGFVALREHMSMDLQLLTDARDIPAAVMADILRIEQLWTDCRRNYATNRGPFLFGEYSIADMMYAPVCFRFESYGVKLGAVAQEYLRAMLTHPDMQEWKLDAMEEQELVAAS